MLARSKLVPFLLALVPCAAQPPATFPAPPEILAHYALRDGTVQNLVLPWQASGPFSVRVVLDGVERTLALVPHDVRARDFVLFVDDGNGLHAQPTPASVTFRGEVAGLDGSAVAASLIDGQLQAIVLLPDGTQWAVQPLTEVHAALPRASHVVYRGTDVVLPDDLRCGAGGRPVEVQGGGGVGIAALKVCEIAVDADLAYYARYGNNATTVQNQVTTVINAVGVIYRRDVEIDYSITTIIVRTTSIYSWNGDLCSLLGQFRNYWNANHGAVRRDVAHLFTGEGSFSGVIGCAYLGVVCTSSGYGSSKAYSSSLTTNTGLVAHEIGHNWNAGHCNSSSPCNIMCSGLGGCSRNVTSFAPVSINAILAFKNSRSCLHDPQPPAIVTLTPNATTSHQPAQVTATGLRLDATTSLTIGGHTVPFTIVNQTTLRFTPPSPMAIGSHPVVASNSAGSSAPVPLTITGNHPSVLVATQIMPRNFANRVSVHSDAGWAGVLLFSGSNQPSAVPGLVSLGIGNNFAELYDYGTVVCGPNGVGLIFVNPPLHVPGGLVLYWQAVTLPPTNPSLPLESSNVQQTTLF